MATTTTSSVSPPPPPPPPSPSDDNAKQTQPSFLQNFITQNTPSNPSNTKQQQFTREYIQSKCLIPITITIPEQALPDITPLLSLSESEIMKDAVQSDNDDFRTALKDFKKAVSLCATYKETSDINQQIFQFKVSRWKINKAISTTEDPQEKQHYQERLDQLEEPPFNNEYTSLKVAQNQALANVYNVNYVMCEAYATCPKQTRQLIKCYESLNPSHGQALAKQGLGKVICMEEREAVERCVGNGVQRVVEEVLN